MLEAEHSTTFGSFIKYVSNFYLGEEGSKFEENVLAWGRGVSKIKKKVLTYFMDGPFWQ
jgi:hypothetical protein